MQAPPPEDPIDSGPAHADEPNAFTSAGERGTTPEFFNQVYQELRDLAHKHVGREREGLTLQTTALVHEVYLRLTRGNELTWVNRRHFFGAAAEAMRRILIERARRYAYEKHGGGRRRLEIADAESQGGAAVLLNDNAESAAAMLDLDDALSELRKQDEPLSELVMLRFFAGLSVEETAAATGRSPRSVKRDWSFARAWLSRRLDAQA